ncbi:MAG TPA: aldehyde dehydrogenase family protein [Candidatus Limnocylindrales bacterium]|nr:aldehyde dehydrogenase family protein [Candidatus Limnocylindrales bacterium]
MAPTVPAPHLDGRMLIGGHRVDAISGDWFETRDPSNGRPLTRVAQGDRRDVDAAVETAREAFTRVWSKTAPLKRVHILNRLAALIREHRADVAALESLDVGKPLREAEADAEAAAQFFEYFAGAADKIFGASIPLGPNMLDYTVREPLGVSAQIVPWNYPLRLACRGIAPALACGNTVVAKPAGEAVLSTLRIAELALEAGLPHGVLNVVTGHGQVAGAALAGHPGINQVTFTGSVPTGIAVMKAAADHVVPVTLELGGKSPNIVFADADLAHAGASAARVILQNAGQTCTAPSRLLVEKQAHAEVLEHAAEVMRRMRLGRGLDNPDMGPVISEPQMTRILEYVHTGVKEGGRVVTGGTRADQDGLRDGYFVRPTLIDQVAPGTTVEQEEIFGPVLTVTTFESVEEAIAIANGTPYGLVTGIWTRDLHRALKVATEVKAGQIRINGYSAEGSAHLPFGGYKKSGFGREQGMEAIAAYTQVKNVMINFG